MAAARRRWRPDSTWRELERQDRRALLAARGERGEVAAVELEGDVVAVRPDERGAVPQLLLDRLVEPASERVGRRLRTLCRRVGDVAEGQEPFLVRDLAVRGRQWSASAAIASSRQADDAAALADDQVVPVGQLVPGRLLLADRGAAASCAGPAPARRSRRLAAAVTLRCDDQLVQQRPAQAG